MVIMDLSDNMQVPFLLQFTSNFPCLVLNITSPCAGCSLTQSPLTKHMSQLQENTTVCPCHSAFVPCWAELLPGEVTQCQPGFASLCCHQSCSSPQLRTVPLLSHDLAGALSGAREGWERDCLLRPWWA